jgi:hypothetical protein
MMPLYGESQMRFALLSFTSLIKLNLSLVLKEVAVIVRTKQHM